MKTTHAGEYGNCAGLPAHQIEAFLERLRRARYSEVTLYKKRRVLRLFLAYLRGEVIMALQIASDGSAIAKIYSRYVDYLSQDRDLAKNSVLVYAPFIRDFLNSQDTGDGHIVASARRHNAAVISLPIAKAGQASTFNSWRWRCVRFATSFFAWRYAS